MLLKFVIFLLVLYLVFSLFDKILRKIANVEKRKGFIYKPVNRNQKIGQRIILALYCIGLIIHGISSSDVELYVLMIIFLVVLNLHRAFMEWKYENESREYIITFSSTVIMVVLMYSFIKFNIYEMLF